MTTRKRRVGLRLIALAVGALIVAGIFAARHWWPSDGAADASSGTSAAPTELSTSVPADEFITFARTISGTIGQTDPEYIATGLRRLAGALDSLDIGGDELALDLRVAAAHVLLQPTSLDNAELVRNLAIRTAQALRPDSPGAVVTSRAQAISDERSLVQQQAALHDFFAAAGDALAERRRYTGGGEWNIAGAPG